jgi:hypothetical protein
MEAQKSDRMRMAPRRSKPFTFGTDPPPEAPLASPVDDRTRGGTTALEPAAPVKAPAPAQTHASALAAARQDLAQDPAEAKSASRGLYLAAAAASIVWIGALAAIAIGYRAAASPVFLALIAALALAPVGVMWAVAYVVSEARRLGQESKRTRRLTEELVGPTALAAVQTGALVEAMRGQIATAMEVANQARDHLTALRKALAFETERLAEATAQASRTAIGLVETLSRERGELNTLALTLDARSSAVTDAINRQAHMVAEASDLAETQLREAEAALAARAADLAAAAGEATDASRVAAEDLGRQIARLETASGGVGDQIRALESELTEQRAALVTVAHALRADQEDFATLAESRTAQLAEFVASARLDVTQLNEDTSAGAGALSNLISEARAKLGELAEAAGAERDAFAKSAEGTLKLLAESGAREREHLETAMRSTIEALSAAAVEAREAADVHAEASRARVDLLNEAAFAAGQKAEQVFDARLTEARGLIENSAKLVEEAGDQAARRLEAQVSAAREALDGLNALMNEVADRAARLPEETGAKAREVKEAVEAGLENLLTSARKAAEETQAIDLAFQERVRRNYEMLSEAVQLMGVVASGGPGASVLQRPSAAERARSRLAAANPARTAERPIEAPPQVGETAEPMAQAAEAPAPSEAALRNNRLKLTPTATDDEFKAAFEAAGGQPPPEESAWTWKELLTTLDGEAPGAKPETAQQPAEAPAQEAIDPSRLGETLFDQISGMGIDPDALLPKGRIEEIAAAVQTGDVAGAREVVRTLAPAAIRRIARRLLADPAFRERAQILTVRFGELVADAARRDKQGFQAAALLSSSSGRAYLLLDAAADLRA